MLMLRGGYMYLENNYVCDGVGVSRLYGYVLCPALLPYSPCPLPCPLGGLDGVSLPFALTLCQALL